MLDLEWTGLPWSVSSELFYLLSFNLDFHQLLPMGMRLAAQRSLSPIGLNPDPVTLTSGQP